MRRTLVAAVLATAALFGCHDATPSGPTAHQIRQRRRDAVGRLVQYGCVGEAAEITDRVVAVTSLPRQKAEEREPVAADR